MKIRHIPAGRTPFGGGPPLRHSFYVLDLGALHIYCGLWLIVKVAVW